MWNPGPPQADFFASPKSGPGDLTVQFTDDSTGIITSWSWDFGDGGTSEDRNPAYTYPHNNEPLGYYSVTLTVTGPEGSDSEVKNDYIEVWGPPVAGFFGNPTSGPAPLKVNFTDTSEGHITSWS